MTTGKEFPDGPGSELLTTLFATILICSNLIGAGKVTTVGGVSFSTGVLIFPISYVLLLIVAETLGTTSARRALVVGLAALVLATVVAAIIVHAPPAPGWPHQAAFETVFGATPRIAAASILAYCAGGFGSIYAVERLAGASGVAGFALRMASAAVVGEALDSLIFYPIAFAGEWPTDLIARILLTNYAIKTAWQLALVPAIYYSRSWAASSRGTQKLAP